MFTNKKWAVQNDKNVMVKEVYGRHFMLLLKHDKFKKQKFFLF